eukprot:5518255-Pyramimonas_sp.AAC.1
MAWETRVLINLPGFMASGAQLRGCMSTGTRMLHTLRRIVASGTRLSCSFPKVYGFGDANIVYFATVYCLRGATVV